jgi:DNA-binding MltR family transcriptional regulator
MESQTRKFDLINESDRGAVIVAAALLEDDLNEILKKIVQRNELSAKYIKEMFDLNGPLSSFSSKALICYGFGIISKDIFDDLTKIRKLRNKFAHSSDRVDFLSSEIEDHVAEIQCCVEASKSFVGEMFKGRGENKLAGQTNAPSLEDWEVRAKGFVKYTKSVFCIGVSLLRIKIKEHQLCIRKT